MSGWWEGRSESDLDGWWVDECKDGWKVGKMNDVGVEAAWCVDTNSVHKESCVVRLWGRALQLCVSKVFMKIK